MRMNMRMSMEMSLGGKLLALISTGQGNVNVHLGQVVPLSSKVNIKSELKIETAAGVAETKLAIDVTISPK